MECSNESTKVLMPRWKSQSITTINEGLQYYSRLITINVPCVVIQFNCIYALISVSLYAVVHEFRKTCRKVEPHASIKECAYEFA